MGVVEKARRLLEKLLLAEDRGSAEGREAVDARVGALEEKEEERRMDG